MILLWACWHLLDTGGAKTTAIRTEKPWLLVLWTINRLAATTMSSKHSEASFMSLKEEGNALFKQQKFEKALKKYSTALRYLLLLSSEECQNDEDQNDNSSNNRAADGSRTNGKNNFYHKAVLHSNHSNCLFELGDYKGSMQEAKECLDIILSSLLPPKNRGADATESSQSSAVEKLH
jgi:tetratricopeptide (TPR) repeat protein